MTTLIDPASTAETAPAMHARRLGIETLQEAHVFLRRDSYVSRAEGFSAHNRVLLRYGDKTLAATLYQVSGDFLSVNEIGVSEWAWEQLGLVDGALVCVGHLPPIASLGQLRAKVYGHALSNGGFDAIIADVHAGNYSSIHLASFITACAARPLDLEEMRSLTAAMVKSGSRLEWNRTPIVDKHSVGGLPGNRTTPIVVAIVAACGLTIPKTSSRAITSPAGTADTMETLAPVDLDLVSMRRVVEREGGCVVWGGAVGLSPTDDTLIRIERVLDLDAEGQLVASILSKKIAAGATHVVLDLPIGPTAKVRSEEAAQSLSRALVEVAETFGVAVRVIASDGSGPVGRGLGPALEALDVLAVLQERRDAPPDLRDHALVLAAGLLEMAGAAAEGAGASLAAETLRNGRAWRKFQDICNAQGGLREPPLAPYTHDVVSAQAGTVTSVDNRRLARLAKLAGAPEAKAAGILMRTRLGDRIERGQPFFSVHAETKVDLDYAMAFAAVNPGIMGVA